MSKKYKENPNEPKNDSSAKLYRDLLKESITGLGLSDIDWNIMVKDQRILDTVIPDNVVKQLEKLDERQKLIDLLKISNIFQSAANLLTNWSENTRVSEYSTKLEVFREAIKLQEDMREFPFSKSREVIELFLNCLAHRLDNYMAATEIDLSFSVCQYGATQESVDYARNSKANVEKCSCREQADCVLNCLQFSSLN